MWVSLHHLLWKGPATNKISSEFKGEETMKVIDAKVNLSKIANFFMNPQTVARNLLVCTSFVSYSLGYCLRNDNFVSVRHHLPPLVLPISILENLLAGRPCKRWKLSGVSAKLRRQNTGSGYGCGECWRWWHLQSSSVSDLHCANHIYQYNVGEYMDS